MPKKLPPPKRKRQAKKIEQPPGKCMLCCESIPSNCNPKRLNDVSQRKLSEALTNYVLKTNLIYGRLAPAHFTRSDQYCKYPHCKSSCTSRKSKVTKAVAALGDGVFVVESRMSGGKLAHQKFCFDCYDESNLDNSIIAVSLMKNLLQPTRK